MTFVCNTTMEEGIRDWDGREYNSRLLRDTRIIRIELHKMPDDVLRLIFAWLRPRDLLCAARVCRRWEALCERVVLCVCDHEELRRLAHTHRALLVRTALPAPMSLVPALVSAAPLLTELTLHAAAALSDDQLAALSRLPHLSHLDVFTRGRVVSARLLPVAARLRSFVLNEGVAAGFLHGLATSTALKELHMYGRSLYYRRKELLTLLTARGAYLTELTLRCTELPDRAYEAIGACANLEALQLYSCWLLTRTGSPHVTRPPRLRRLHVTGARLVRRRALAALVESLPLGIEELSLSASWFGDEHVPLLITRLPNLRVLELWRCRELTAAGVEALAEKLPHLRTLDLDLELSDEVLRRLQDHPSLLHLRYFPPSDSQVFSAGLQSVSLARSSCLARLRVDAAGARYPRKYFRGGGEGFRADLFYFWTQHVRLQPLKHGMLSIFDEEDDD